MCHVAAEMERQGFDLPLLIGGATTSRVHTAVKIHPNYRRGQTVYVNDASRAVGVVASLMSARGAASAYVAEIRAEYARIAAAHARGEEKKQRLSLAGRARQCAQARLVGQLRAAAPIFLGTQVLEDYPLAELRRLHRLDAVLRDLGAHRQVSRDPRRRQDRRGGAQPLRRRAGDARTDRRRSAGSAPRRVRLLAGQCRRRRHPGLRRRDARRSRSRRCTRCASSSPGARAAPMWRSPISWRRARAALADYIGAFVVTAGIGEDDGRRALQARQRRLFRDHGQGAGRSAGGGLRRAAAPARAQGILGLRAGRGARHRRADRREISRHPPGARLSGAARPHREGDAVRAARRRARASACELTESFAMWPGASVCGLYFSHPESHYFGVGKIERDQVEDYARRKGWTRRARRRSGWRRSSTTIRWRRRAPRRNKPVALVRARSVPARTWIQIQN